MKQYKFPIAISIIVMILLIIGAFFWPIIAGVALIVGFFKAMIERYKKL